MFIRVLTNSIFHSCLASGRQKHIPLLKKHLSIQLNMDSICFRTSCFPRKLCIAALTFTCCSIPVLYPTTPPYAPYKKLVSEENKTVSCTAGEQEILSCLVAAVSVPLWEHSRNQNLPVFFCRITNFLNIFLCFIISKLVCSLIY